MHSQPVILNLNVQSILLTAACSLEIDGKGHVDRVVVELCVWLYATSMATGSAFSGTQICRSDLFGFPQFAIPLNEIQIVGFQSKSD